MGKRKGRREPSAPRMPREAAYVPKAGLGQTFIQEGERESRHFKNVGHPLDLAYERGQIAKEHWDVGDLFRVTFEKLGRSGKDSSQALMSAGGSSDRAAAWTQAMVDATKVMTGIQKNMPARSYRIVRYFCGEGLAMSEAVQRVTPCHPSNTRYRIVEALEELEDAITRIDKELRPLLGKFRQAAA